MSEDRADRIERAARAMATDNGDDFDAIPKHKGEWVDARGMFNGRYRSISEPMQPDYIGMATAALTAAYPELMADPPSHWIAPMDLTKDMWTKLAVEIFHERTPEEAWQAARDAHLKEQSKA